MYAVSDSFLTTIKQNTRRYYWTGKIATTGGTGTIETGGIIASISGQSMAAGKAWDGRIAIEETISRISLSRPAKPRTFMETAETEISWVVNYYWSDSISAISVGAFGTITETGGTA